MMYSPNCSQESELLDSRGQRWQRVIMIAVLIAVLIALTSPASAQLRPGLAGNFATGDNAATAYYNPAAMTRLDRREFIIDSTFAYTKSKFDVNDKTTVPGGNSDTNEGLVMIPSFYFATPAFHERLRLGGSLNIPSGIGADYGKKWSGRYIATESSLFYIAINGAVAVRVSDWLSLGGSLEILYTKSENRSRINNLADNRSDGSVKLETSGIGVGGGVSVLLTLSESFRVGVSYRPKTETDVDGVPELENIGPGLTAALVANDLFNKKIEIGMNSPQRVSLGIAAEPIPRLSIAVDFSWIDMEQFGNVDVTVSDSSVSVDGQWQDTYLVGISLGWKLTDELQALVGFSYLSPPISDSKRNFALPVGRIYVVGAGLRYKYRDWVEFHGAINYFDMGNAKIDDEPSAWSGRVAGKFSTNYAIGFNTGVIFRI